MPLSSTSDAQDEPREAAAGAEVLMTYDGDYVAVCETAAEAREAIEHETGAPCLYVREVGISRYRATKAMIEAGEFEWDAEPGDHVWTVIRGGKGAWMVGFDAPLWRQEPLPLPALHWADLPVGTPCYYEPEGHGKIIAPPRTWRASGKPVVPILFENGSRRELFLGQFTLHYGGPLQQPEHKVRVFVGDELVCDGCSQSVARLMIALRTTRLRLEWEAAQLAEIQAVDQSASNPKGER